VSQVPAAAAAAAAAVSQVPAAAAAAVSKAAVSFGSPPHRSASVGIASAGSSGISRGSSGVAAGLSVQRKVSFAAEPQMLG
jgi:hypothetical protein